MITEKYIVYERSTKDVYNWLPIRRRHTSGDYEHEARRKCAKLFLDGKDYKVVRITSISEDFEFDDLAKDIEELQSEEEQIKIRKLEEARKLIAENDNSFQKDG